MASRYHPLYGGLWQSPHLEGMLFEGKAFFAYLFSNDRVRPSGIYRVTDAQLASETRLPMKRVLGYLNELARRDRIVRDGDWLFLVGTLKRQARGARLLLGVKSDVESCESVAILEKFGLKYPAYNRWSREGLLTLKRGSNHRQQNQGDNRGSTEGQQRVNRPSVNRPTNKEFSIGDQRDLPVGRSGTTDALVVAVEAVKLESTAEAGKEEHEKETNTHAARPNGHSTIGSGAGQSTVGGSHSHPPATIVFQIPSSIEHALKRAPRLGGTPRLHVPAYWQAQLRANPGVSFGDEILKAEAYLVAHPERRYRDLPAFLHNWLKRAERREEA